MEEKTRSDSEQDKEENPPLPGTVIGEETNGHEKDEGEDADGQTAQAESAKKKPLASRPGRVRGAWKSTSVANKLTAIFTGITALAAAVTVCLYLWQVQVMKSQLNIMDGQLKQMKADSESSSIATSEQLSAMKEQGKAMAGQLDEMRLDSRPWVGLDDERPAIQTGPITFDASGNAQGSCVVMAKNFGRRPAYSVMPFAELMIVQETNSVNARRKELISEMEGARFGPILFPGSGRVINQWGIGVPASKIVRNPQFAPEFLAFIVGGIAYRDQIGAYHCTTFTYRLQVPGTIKGVAFIPSPDMTIKGDWVLTSSSAN